MKSASITGRCFLAGALGIVIGGGASGCSRSKASEDADMKKAFSQKTFSINDVPPEQRERVRAIMEAQKGRKK